MNEDLVLVPEVEARRALSERRIRLQVLVPVGSWIGYGRLRVLRLKVADARENDPNGADVELIVGYEAYKA